jgi:single-strand DNA-binding protein
MNNHVLAGRIGGDPRLASVNGQDGAISVLNFSLAVDKRQKGADGRALTLWVDCSLWGKRADALAPYIKKGGYVTVTGESDVETFQGRDGLSAKMICRVNDLKLQGQAAAPAAGAPANQPAARPAQQNQNAAAAQNNYNQRPAEPTIDFDDDIPF